MVEVLLAAFCVCAGGLDVRKRIKRDPDIRPRGRDCQSMDPAQCLGVGDRISVWIDVLKVVWRSETADARLVVADVVQASLGRRGGAQTGVLRFWGPQRAYTRSVALTCEGMLF